jgi:penicillin-binding protein 1A
VTAVWLGNDDSSPTKKMTGGGLPSEIWARFMKGAHRNVEVANLPGSQGGFFAPLAHAGPGLSPSQAPVPPGSIPGGRSAAIQPSRNDGMDSWLIDRLFGRR